MGRRSSLVVGLDVGTTKVVAVVAERVEGGLAIVGMGEAPSRGLRKGMVVDIAATVVSIREAVAEAERNTGCRIGSVYAGISGAHVKAFNSHGVTAIKNGEVRVDDLSRVLASARAAAIPQDREILHILPQDYIIDNQEGIRAPVGICGVRFEARVHVVTAASAAVANITRCAEEAGLSVADMVLEPLASSHAVLTEEERDLGVCLVDIGGGTTDLAIFSNGALVHTAVIGLGGNHFTNDLVQGLRTTLQAAEQLKVEHGCALASMISPDDMIDVPSVGDREPRRMSRQVLCDILEPRVDELFRLVSREIQRCGYEDHLTSGVVLTGGASRLPGIEEMAEDVLRMLVRRGEPRGVGGESNVVRGPQYATGVGLALYATRADEQRFFMGKPRRGLWSRFASWFEAF